jgi:3-oxoacyl-[acyl-carrier protein] reductase
MPQQGEYLEKHASPAVALVTGAAGGLGRACCAELCRRQAHVIAADIATEPLRSLTEALQAEGKSITSAQLDVSDRGQVEALINQIIDEYGRLSVLVNLAGVLRNALLAKIDDGDFELTMSTHVRGTLNTMRAVVPHMRASGYGRIVNTSSIAARGSIAGSSYGAAKGAIEGLSRSAAIELAPYGVTINCIAPGLIDAGVFLTVPKKYHDEGVARVPMKRAGTADEVAACVAFLVSSSASYITGQTLSICGGATLGF